MMGDYCPETLQQSQSRQNDEKIAFDSLLGEDTLTLDQTSFPWILNHIDCFVSQSRGNKNIEDVFLCPYAFNGHDDGVWDKVGQAVGNLQELRRLYISSDRENDNDSDSEDEDEDPPNPDWERLARILSHMRQKISVYFADSIVLTVQESRSFARVIHGHPTITSFDSCYKFPYESLDTLYSVLATLPALESIALSNRRLGPEDESPLANPESLTELLRTSSLRSVWFRKFYFTRALCQATVNALLEGTAITQLRFSYCAFFARECAMMMAHALSRNTTVKCIEVLSPFDGTLHDALAMALHSNSTLQNLSLVGGTRDAERLSPVLLALRKNKGLETLKVDACASMDESLCTAMQHGFGMNETLQSLEFIYSGRLLDENCTLWSRAFSFLRTNKALKHLMIDVHRVPESCVSTIRIDIVEMLQENASLGSLAVLSMNLIKSAEYIALVTALQHNCTLNTLKCDYCGTLELTHDEDKQMATLLQKNYALVSLPDLYLKNGAGDVGAILRLNDAGRRYLIEDGSSISKGVKVLSAVSNEINCVFLHLSENPRLCDRSAVETAASDTQH
jgi:hypothetical protein